MRSLPLGRMHLDQNQGYNFVAAISLLIMCVNQGEGLKLNEILE